LTVIINISDSNTTVWKELKKKLLFSAQFMKKKWCLWSGCLPNNASLETG